MKSVIYVILSILICQLIPVQTNNSKSSTLNLANYYSLKAKTDSAHIQYKQKNMYDKAFFFPDTLIYRDSIDILLAEKQHGYNYIVERKNYMYKRKKDEENINH